MTKTKALKLGYCTNKNHTCAAYHRDKKHGNRQNCLPYLSDKCPLTEDTIKLWSKAYNLVRPRKED